MLSTVLLVGLPSGVLTACGSTSTTAGPGIAADSPGRHGPRQSGGRPTDAASTSTPGGSPSAGATPTPPGVTGLPVPIDLARAFTRLLDARTRAVLDHDRSAFLAGLDTSDPSFVAEQEALFDNLAQLPLQTYSARIVPASLTRVDGGYEVVVEVSQQLTGYDAAPVTRPERYLLHPTDRRGRFLLAGTADRAFERQLGVVPPPWEVEPITVRSVPGVLGVFDAASIGRAKAVLRSVEDAIPLVASSVPYSWSQQVVVYALGDGAYFDGLGGLPGGDPVGFDGLALQIPASSSDPAVAATRVALGPDVLTAPRLSRDRLVRHELTHLAVGSRADGVPVWLREGLAEWVSVQGLRPSQQTIAPAAVTAARDPGVVLPADADFDDADAPAHYALSWFACAYLAQADGPSAPWRLLDRLDRADGSVRDRAGDGHGADGDGGGQGDPDEAAARAALRKLFRITPDQLARRAARLLVRQADGAAQTPGPPR